MSSVPPPLERLFSLRLRLPGAAGAWSAEMRAEDGEHVHFRTPLELYRYLVQLALPPLDDGGLR